MSARGDREWMYKRRNSEGRLCSYYQSKVNEFLNFAFSIERVVEKKMFGSDVVFRIKCSCSKCKIKVFKKRDEVKLDLWHNGFIRGYTTWYAHGERKCRQAEIGSSEPIEEDNENASVYKSWERVMSSRYSGILGQCQRDAAHRATMDNITAVEYIKMEKKSNVARQNRLTEVDGEVSKHTAGSKPILQHKFQMDAVEAAIVEKHGPDASEHPPNDLDLWGEVTMGGRKYHHWTHRGSCLAETVKIPTAYYKFGANFIDPTGTEYRNNSNYEMVLYLGLVVTWLAKVRYSDPDAWKKLR
uniref:Transposase-associated domain-containing protein n=1 Tax=Tanacetum cinerariifolium TaxID=118510 RepID=A0A6L2MYQ2_TANCI|nr:hypothetical protein [Tanacetum cinerariifolium]